MGRDKETKRDKATGDAPEPIPITDEYLQHLEELAKFWDNPEVQRLLAERARQEAEEKKRGH